MKKISLLLRIPLSIILLALAVLVALEFSPIYRFEKPRPFSGEFIYNPYASLDTTLGWKRANLHTHTRVDNILNECELYPDSILQIYRKLSYDIVAFSNHMELTEYPGDKSEQIWVYEHGWNAGRLHNLVYNPRKVHFLDSPCAFFPSLQQFKIDRLTGDCDFIVLNHPDRSDFMSKRTMRSLTGYRLIEGISRWEEKYCRAERWDQALSAGHYAPSAASDDLHHPERSCRIAIRCTFLNTPSKTYTDIKETLLKGNSYSMFLPDFGNGDWDAKIKGNASLPFIENIGISENDTVFIRLSQPAVSIEAIGQGGKCLATVLNANSFKYRFLPEDSYIRLVAKFQNGCVIYSNPFARWNGSTESGTPYLEAPHHILYVATALYNLALLCLVIFLVFIAVRNLRIFKIRS